MSVESDAFRQVVADTEREKNQIIPFIVDLQTRLAQAAQALADAIATGAADAEVAAAARELMPNLQQVVTELDQFTPEGTPIITP